MLWTAETLYQRLLLNSWNIVPEDALNSWNIVPEAALNSWNIVPEHAMNTWNIVAENALNSWSKHCTRGCHLNIRFRAALLTNVLIFRHTNSMSAKGSSDHFYNSLNMCCHLQTAIPINTSTNTVNLCFLQCIAKWYITRQWLKWVRIRMKTGRD